MNNPKFEIIPEYQFAKYFQYLIFSIAFLFLITPIIINEYEVLSFFGLILIFIGLAVKIFTSKRSLKINQELIKFDSKSIVKEFSKSVSINFNDIEKIFFLKRQFLILGGRSPIADVSEQTLYNENRIVFILKDNKNETILQVGKINEFKKAYSIIENRIAQK